MARAGTPVALDVLVQGFALSPLERSVVVLCLAPDLDPAFERLYAYVQDDATRKYATAALALALFGGEAEGRRRCDASCRTAPLRRYRLVTLRDRRPARATRAPGRCGSTSESRDYLLGVNRLDERLAQLLRAASRRRCCTEREEVDAAYGQAGASIGVPGAGRR